MADICTKCGSEDTRKISEKDGKCTVTSCGGKTIWRPDFSSPNHGSPWQKVELKRTASQVFAEGVTADYDELIESKVLGKDEQESVFKRLQIGDYGDKYKAQYETFKGRSNKAKKNIKINKKDMERFNRLTEQELFKFKSYVQDTPQTKYVRKYQERLKQYQDDVKIRDAPKLKPGAHRRNSIDFENTIQPADMDTTDCKRPLLGGAPKGKGSLDRVVKIAVLSVHGQDNKDMCTGYNTQFQTALAGNLWNTKYKTAMEIETTPSMKMAVREWIMKTLEGRARPDIIVLLEGHVTDTGCDLLTIGTDIYKRQNSGKHQFLKDHLQNITGWIRKDIKQTELQLDIKPVTVKGAFTTDVAVITHKVAGKSYYELVCHLPNDHCKIYKMEPDIGIWYSENKNSIAKDLNSIDPESIINVMGDTNFNTAYDEIWSSAPSFGGDIGSGTYNKAFPASSADTRFMRQMCNAKHDWENSQVRLHRASYLNHIPVRDGEGMAKPWGTDHPSFMSYTSIYK